MATRQAPHTLTVIRHRAQPPVVTIFRLTVTALFAYVLALNLTSTPRPVLAPLTALLVVQVSLYQTVQSALTKVLAVVIGVLLAILLSDTLGFTWWTLTVIIAMALVIGYVLRLGANILEVPVSAMLILATSSTASQRILDTIIGAAAGLLAGFVLVSPQVETAEDAIQEHCSRMADLLDQMAAGLCGGSVRNEAEGWLRQARGLADEIGQVDDALRKAEESIRLNPRKAVMPLSTVSLREGVETIEHEAIALRVFARSLTDSSRLDDPDNPMNNPEVRARLAAVLTELSAALRIYGGFTVKHEEGDHERLESELDQHLHAAEGRQNELSELLNSDPHAKPAGWPLRGEMIAHLDRLRRELGSGKPAHAIHQRGRSILRPGWPPFWLQPRFWRRRQKGAPRRPPSRLTSGIAPRLTGWGMPPTARSRSVGARRGSSRGSRPHGEVEGVSR
ncbi:MAG TPA: aromatic acid exporter family protein [Trebonia sp.]